MLSSVLDMMFPFIVGSKFSEKCLSLSVILYHKLKAVVYVGLGGVAVEVQEKQAESGIELLDPFFDTFGYDVVGDAPERLEADNFQNSLFRQSRLAPTIY